MTFAGERDIITLADENDAGWSSLEARRAHNPKVTGSNPVPATLMATTYGSGFCFINSDGGCQSR